MEAFAELKKVLDEAGEDWVRRFQREIKITRTRTAIRATWKGTKGNMRPASFQRKRFKANLMASGKLYRSAGYKTSLFLKSYRISLIAEDYAIFVNDGRKPFLKKPRKGKGIPVAKMTKWVESRNLRPRNLVSGAFVKNTATARRSMGFLMNRKIKWFGIEPTGIIDESREATMEAYDQAIADAIVNDATNIINNALNQ